MNYLITLKDHEPFFTNWFDVDNNYVPGMVVYNLLIGTYTTNGTDWKEIKQDHL